MSAMSRSALRQRTALWVAGSVVGGAIVALPDSGRRLFSLSDSHGPSMLDLLGIVVLVATWLPLAVLLPRLWRGAPRVAAAATALLALAGAVGLVVTIGADLGWTWVLPAGALTLTQLVLVADGLRRPSLSEP